MTETETTRHEFDADSDRCVCGGVVVYFERPTPDETGDGCEVEGRPWRWTLVEDSNDPDFDPDGGTVYRHRREGDAYGLAVSEKYDETRTRWFALVLVEQPGTRYFSDGSGEPPYVEDHDLGIFPEADLAKATVETWISEKAAL